MARPSAFRVNENHSRCELRQESHGAMTFAHPTEVRGTGLVVGRPYAVDRVALLTCRMLRGDIREGTGFGSEKSTYRIRSDRNYRACFSDYG
jgi:hypothetical protein